MSPLWLTLLLGCDRPVAPPEAAAPRPPNVLFVVWDTVRADRLELYGHDRPTAPNLTRRAATGVVYERAVSPGVWTLPSHASLFTGLAVSEHGVGDPHKWLDDGFVTMAERLAGEGWATFAWSANPFVSRKTNLLQGFDDVAHPWAAPWAAPSKRLQARRRVDERSTRGDDGPQQWSMSATGEVGVEAVLGWIDRQRADRPWLVFVNLMEAHATRSPTLEARRRVMDEDRVQRSLQLDQRNPRLQGANVGVRTLSDDEVETVRRTYDATIVELDTATERLLAGLEQRGALDDTIVVLVADHGELLGEHGLYGHQLAVWNELTRVPLVVWAPGRLPPGRVPEPTSTLVAHDLVLALTGVGPRPEPRLAATEYREPMATTLRLLHQAAPGRDLSAFEQPLTALEDGPHKLVRAAREAVRVFDVRADPREAAPLDAPAVTDELTRRLASWEASRRAYVGEGMPTAKIDADPEARVGLRELGYVE